jgi:cephalosporin hydroxylase
LGQPIIQYPQDMVEMQELIWKVKPDPIIETGISHGSSLIMSASMLALLDMCEAIESGIVLEPENSKRKVLGLEFDIRQNNREAVEAHPMSSRIQMIQGSGCALRYSHTAILGLSLGPHGRSGNIVFGKSSTIVSNTTQ